MTLDESEKNYMKYEIYKVKGKELNPVTAKMMSIGASVNSLLCTTTDAFSNHIRGTGRLCCKGTGSGLECQTFL